MKKPLLNLLILCMVMPQIIPLLAFTFVCASTKCEEATPPRFPTRTISPPSLILVISVVSQTPQLAK
jgi:hypothetical protein